MIHRTASFVVLLEKIDKAIELINIFADEVNTEEVGCQLYRSLQSREDPTIFLHYMIFDNKEAEEYHRTTLHVKEFVDQLYPLLERKPTFIGYNRITG